MSADRLSPLQGLAVFSTAIGWCGLAWGERGLIGAQLPELTADRTRERLARRFPDAVQSAPTPEVQRVADAIVALMAGEAADLTFAVLDIETVSAFNRQVYAIARAIGPGETRTYGEIATALGDLAASRAVGRALGDNPWPIVVPCHRVLAAGGGIGGFSANGGVTTKARLLSIEKARTSREPSLFDEGATFSLAPARGAS